MSLATKVKLYCSANGISNVDFRKDVKIVDLSDGTGAKIIEWNIDSLAQPTDEQLNSYNSSATTEENNNIVIRNRKSEYGTTEHQIENIIENGLSAEQTRVQAIKDKYPKE